jgi:hypothetical protein
LSNRAIRFALPGAFKSAERQGAGHFIALAGKPTFVEPLRWLEIAEGVSCPAAVASGERRVTLFARGAGGELLVFEREQGAWSGPRSLGVPLARTEDGGSPTMPVDWPIAACATGPAEIQLLARGPEGELVHGTLRGSEWGGFECVGLPADQVGATAVPMGLASAPTACSRGSGKMDVFAVESSGRLLHSEWDGAEFAEFELLGTVVIGERIEPVRGPISACGCGVRAMAIAARGALGDLLIKWWDGAKWTPFASLGFATAPDPVYPAVDFSVPIASAPVACGGGSTRLDVFARGQAGDLLHKWWDGKDWSPFESLGLPRSGADGAPTAFTGVSLACVWGKFQLDVFARAADGKLYNASSKGTWDHERPAPEDTGERLISGRSSDPLR